MHLILYQRKRKSIRIDLFRLKIFFFSSGIFHFVKDNYFRTSSSSSDDEYDSDDSAQKGENSQTKSQPLVGSLINTAAVATAVATSTSASILPSGNDAKR